MSFQVAHNGVSTGRAYEYGGIFPLFGWLAGAAKAFLPTIAATVIPSLGQAIAGRVTAAIAGPAPAPQLSTVTRLEDEEFEFMDADTDELDAILAELDELEMAAAAPAPARFTTVLSQLQPALEVSPSARFAGWRN